MQMSNATMFSCQGVVGYAYHDAGNTRAIIWCKGGPSLGDDGESEVFSEVSSKLGVSVVVPDYLGSGRSAGKAFTIQRAVQTVSICENFLVNDQAVVDCWKNEKVQFGIGDVMLVGYSWGATMAALYPKFYPDTSIDQIAFISGVLNYDPEGHVAHGGESDAEFWQQISNGWSNYYRGILDSDWKDLALGGDTTHNPLHNVSSLLGKRIQIVHGEQDKVIAYQRSEQFRDLLEERGIDSDIILIEGSHFSVKSLETITVII